MSSVTKRRDYTYLSDDAALAVGQLVKLGSDSKHVTVATATSENSLGFSQTVVSVIGDAVEVAMVGGGAKMLAGGTISKGDYLMFATGGKVVTATGSGVKVVGQANEDAVLNDVFSGEVVHFVLP